MEILLTEDKKELIVSCKCGCEEGLHIKIDDSFGDFSYFSYVSGKFYRDKLGVFRCLREKSKKIWAIIRSKDYYYSDIIMSKSDFEQFKLFVNQFDG